MDKFVKTALTAFLFWTMTIAAGTCNLPFMHAMVDSSSLSRSARNPIQEAVDLPMPLPSKPGGKTMKIAVDLPMPLPSKPGGKTMKIAVDLPMPLPIESGARES